MLDSNLDWFVVNQEVKLSISLSLIHFVCPKMQFALATDD